MRRVAKTSNRLELIQVAIAALSFTAASASPLAAERSQLMQKRQQLYGRDASFVSDTVLDQMRGGFTLADGVMITFGIERATYINGVLKTSTSLNLPLNLLSAGSTVKLPIRFENSTQVQNGSGNVHARGAADGNLQGTFIQNALNNQSIRATTTVNAIRNTSQVMKSLNFAATLRDAIGATVGGR